MFPPTEKNGFFKNYIPEPAIINLVSISVQFRLALRWAEGNPLRKGQGRNGLGGWVGTFQAVESSLAPKLTMRGLSNPGKGAQGEWQGLYWGPLCAGPSPFPPPPPPRA